MTPPNIHKHSNISCMFLKPNYLSNYNCFDLLDLKTSRNNSKNYSVSKTFLTFCSSDNLSSIFSSASNFKNFSRTVLSHRRSEKLRKQNTISISSFFQVDNESQLQALDDYYYYEEDDSRYSNRKGPIYDYYDYDMDDRIHDIRKNNAIFRYVILRNILFTLAFLPIFRFSFWLKKL